MIFSTALFALGMVCLTMAAPQYHPSPSQSGIYHDQDHTGYGKYRFGYQVDDDYTYNHQTRHEEKDDNGVVRGSYSLVEPDGNLRTVHYVADEYGFRAFVDNSHKPDSSHGDVAPVAPYDPNSYNRYYR